MIPLSSAGNVTIDNTTSIQNAVNNANGSGDTIFLKPGTYYESGIHIDKNITLQGLGTPDQIIIDGQYKNTIMLINSVSQVKFFNLTFIHGNSPDYGGAIHSELGGQIYVDSCDFIDNYAATNGGAIDIAGEQHNEKRILVTNFGYLKATNCNFINNEVGHDGGAIATYWGNSYVYNSYFTKNYAKRDGGAIRVGVYSTTLTENCIFDNNTAKEWGGALYNWPGQLNVNNCTISNNYAGEQGGAMITSGGLTVRNSLIVNNTGVSRGGVLVISEELPQIPSTVIFENNFISGNKAMNGSLVYVEETTSTLTNFNKNYWDVDPNSAEWQDAFITNNLINNPTEFLNNEENSNPVNPAPVEENTEQPEQTNTTETSENSQNGEITEPSENIINNRNALSNSTNAVNSNVGSNNEAINSQASQSSSSEKKTAHEIVKKGVNKQTMQSPLVYVAVILILLIILGYGYYRHNKND